MSRVSEIVTAALRENVPDKSQKQIAAEMGIHPQMLSMIKNGKTAIPFARVYEFAVALEIDFPYLLRMWIEDAKTEEAVQLGKAFADMNIHCISKNEMAVLEWWRSEQANAGREPPVSVTSAGGQETK